MKKALFYAFAFVAIQYVCGLLTQVLYNILILHYDLLEAVRSIADGTIQSGSIEMCLASGMTCLLCLYVFVRCGWCSGSLFRFPMPHLPVAGSSTSEHYTHNFIDTPPPFHHSNAAIAGSPQMSVERAIAVLLLAAATAAAAILPSVSLQELLPPLPDLMEDTPLTKGGPLPLAVTVVIFAPVMEEVVFRGAVLHHLLHRYRSDVWPIILSALLFALIHINPTQMLHAFMVGLILGYIFSHTHSLIACMVCHGTNNAMALLLPGILNLEDDTALSDIFHSQPATAAICVCFSLLMLMIFLAGIRQLCRR